MEFFYGGSSLYSRNEGQKTMDFLHLEERDRPAPPFLEGEKTDKKKNHTKKHKTKQKKPNFYSTKLSWKESFVLTLTLRNICISSQGQEKYQIMSPNDGLRHF